MIDAQILEHLERSRSAQGLPMTVDDPGVLTRIARCFDVPREAAA